MSKLNLPNDLVNFLKAGKKLEYDPSKIEPGYVGLTPLEELELGVVWINSDESPLMNDDPNKGEDGYYEIPAISLSGECEAYDPEFILLWLPNEEMYGSWDCDHWDLYVFENILWQDIVANPGVYLDAMWNDYNRKYSNYFKPYPKYQFKKGMPF